jgi:ubiquinone/menaquinone biosynthesis C-methylase UbiE
MAQIISWEEEYKKPQLISRHEKPQNYVLRFFKYLKKEIKWDLSNLKVLDLGCGTGRNSNYLAERGSEVVGLDISRTAIALAKEQAVAMDVADKVDYFCQSMGESYKFPDEHFDLVLDITSSNALNEKEREIYINEVYRVLKPGGYFLVRSLGKDGDKNAKNLLKNSPGKEYDTYYMKELKLFERVFSEADFRKYYGAHFKIVKLIKDSGYAKINGRIFQRRYLLGYLIK